MWQGNIPMYPAALKARDEIKIVIANSEIPRLQRFDNITLVDLGRWPRLSHRAPLALTATQLPLFTQVCHCPINGAFKTNCFFIPRRRRLGYRKVIQLLKLAGFVSPRLNSPAKHFEAPIVESPVNYHQAFPGLHNSARHLRWRHLVHFEDRLGP